MNECETLSQTTWDREYHVVFIPKFRRKTIYASLRPHLGARVFRQRGGAAIRAYIQDGEKEDIRLGK